MPMRLSSGTIVNRSACGVQCGLFATKVHCKLTATDQNTWHLMWHAIGDGSAKGTPIPNVVPQLGWALGHERDKWETSRRENGTGTRPPIYKGAKCPVSSRCVFSGKHLILRGSLLPCLLTMIGGGVGLDRNTRPRRRN